MGPSAGLTVQCHSLYLGQKPWNQGRLLSKSSSCLMLFEWDEAKRAANFAKHGVDFAAVLEFDWETAVRSLDMRRDYGERRRRALGLVGERLHLLVYTERAGRIRVISLRKANRKERRSYEAETRPVFGRRGSGDPTRD